MPSTSPGNDAFTNVSHPFDQIFPGNPVVSLQCFDTFVYRQRRYATYITGSQLNILVQPNLLIQVVAFNHQLVAVVADDETGELLVSGIRDVWVLRPQTEGWTKIWWEKALNLQREDAGDRTHRMSWGSDGEALIGGSRVLSLFATRPASRSSSSLGYRQEDDRVEKRQALWSKGIPSPLLFAEFSPSASLIASCSHHDRLLKIWRRLSYEECLFDHTYLPHPGSITHVQWRPHSQSNEERSNSGSSSRHDDEAEVLFTVANDALLRIWRTAGMHDADIMVQYATIDLVSSIPQSPDLLHRQRTEQSKPTRFFFVIPSEQFCAAIRAAVGFLKSDTVDHATEHLDFMVSQEPDVVISFDGHGRMSAWGLQSIGHRRRPDTPSTPQPFHIAHAEGLAFQLPTDTPTVFKPWVQENKLNFLAHTLLDHGQIHWWEGDAKSLFSLSAPGNERLHHKCTWQGHSRVISDLHVRGSYLTSQSLNDSKIWTLDSADSISFSTSFELGSNVKDIIGLDQDRYITFQESKIVLWDQHGKEIASASPVMNPKARPYLRSSDRAEVSGFLLSPEDGSVAQLTARFSTLATSTPTAELSIEPGARATPSLRFEFSVLVSTCDSTDNRVIACTSEGSIYKSSPISEQVTDLIWKHRFETGVVDPIAFTAAQEFAGIVAAVNPGQILIADLEDGYIEHRQTFDQPVRHIEAVTLNSHASFLAVAFSDSVYVLAKGQYSNSRAADSTWIAAKRISMQEIGLQVNEMAWLPNGILVAAAGNGLFSSDHNVRIDDLSLETQERMSLDATTRPNIDLQSLANHLQTPLPVWHPDFLNNLLDHGSPVQATSFLGRLAQKLKFWSPGDHLDPCLDEPIIDVLSEPEEAFDLSENTITDLREQLEEKLLPYLCRSENERLKQVIDALVFLKDHVNGLDRNALRFLYAWKLQILSHTVADVSQGDVKHAVGHVNPPFVPTMGWKEIAFARQSTTQQPLLDFMVLHYDNKITWPIARNLGIAAWLSDREALEKIFEQLAQTAYRSQQPADPVDASLYFLALHKKPTLLALWRIATWHKEQRSTMNFLKRDFAQTEARTAAKKNAYALMGKRRFEYCAAFFLLADDPASAISVLAGQCDDLPLAIAVARLYSGDGSTVLRKLLGDRVIPRAKQDGNRWLLSWCHAVLFERTEAAQSLIQPLEGIRTWRQDEPSTLALYRQFGQSSSEHEYTAILRVARILRNMGLWFSALDLVCRWDFTAQQTAARTSKGASTTVMANGDQETEESSEVTTPQPSQTSASPSLLDGFTQPMQVQPAPLDDKAAREAKAAELLKKLKEKKDGQQPTTKPVEASSSTLTQFKEPDANSLLDSFGF